MLTAALAFLPALGKMPWKLIGVVAFILGLVGYHWIAVHDAREEGAATERAIWLEVQHMKALEQEGERLKTAEQLHGIAVTHTEVLRRLHLRNADLEERLATVSEDTVCIPKGVIK